MKTLFNEGWKFLETGYGTEFEEIYGKLDQFKAVTIPHDYMITDIDNLYRDSNGWYYKEFEVSDSDLAGELILVFDGIYMDSKVYVNGAEAGEWKYGYSQFVLNITPFVKEGSNTLFVVARCKFPNTRWYSGAGIYRNVWLCNHAKTYIPENGVYVHTKKVTTEGSADYRILVSTEVTGVSKDNVEISYELFDASKESVTIEECENEWGSVFEDTADTKIYYKAFLIKNVKEWDIKAPNLYSLRVTLNPVSGTDATNPEVTEVVIGFREVEFNPEKGFFLNGKNMKLNGVCLHHDLGALGSAYNNTAMRRRLIQLKEMGVNALRLTHNMYDPQVIQMADEMGFLLDSEAFDMWEGPKTEFDYARFFPEWHGRDVASWVRRDRNHPSVIMWSIGNEIYDTHTSERGQEVTRDLKNNVELHDPLLNARATIGSNYMPWENARKCADILKVAGYNYAENYYKEHHKEHPDWIIYGSETYSIVQSRGVYHFPLAVPTLCESDLQCSSLGNSTTSWGADSIENCICKDRDMEFSMGQFIWTGYDYIGEPTPYQTKNSYFGLIDTAGFYKDAFYAWKSAWVSASEDPFVHLFPYWDFNEGQLIDLRVCSNAPEVELFVNGKSQGRQQLTHEVGSGNHIFADYQVAYEKGEITAVAYDAAGNEIAIDSHRSFGDTESFVVEIDHRLDEYGAKDLLFAEISALDSQGNPVENAADYVNVSVVGDGELVGLDNGDSTDYDSYQSSCRKLFNGKLLAIVKVTGDPDSVQVKVEKAAKVPVRKVELSVVRDGSEAGESNVLTAENNKLKIRATVYPENATDKKLVFRALHRNGTDSNIAKINPQGNECEVEGIGDGSLVLRCEAQDEKGVATVISSLEFEVTGMGQAYFDPYGFISGSLYTSTIGLVGNGNEHGFASARGDETTVIYENVDFGKDYSDEITIPIFALNDDEYRIDIWKGIPGEDGACLLKEAHYQKKSIWNTYQEDTWKLDEKLTGLVTISLRVYQKMHIKGFSFNRLMRAFENVKALDCDSIYGDSFTKTENTVEGIGNNVTLAFDGYNFGEKGTKKVVICGRAKDAANTIHLRLKNEASEEVKEILEFPKSEEYTEVAFPIGEKKGKWNLSFVFLPGSNFDFDYFRFE